MKYKECPKCKRFIMKCPRYMNQINQILNDINAIKVIVCFKEVENLEYPEKEDRVIEALISNMNKFDTNAGYFKIFKTNIEKQKKDCDIARRAKETIKVDQVR